MRGKVKRLDNSLKGIKKRFSIWEELKIRERGSRRCVVKHDRGDTVRTRSSVNRNTRNETANFVWVADEIRRVVL